MTHKELIKIAKPLGMTEANFHKCVDGSKTETRRVMPVQPPDDSYQMFTVACTTGDKRTEGMRHWMKIAEDKITPVDSKQPYFKPRYKVGDICYLREPVQLLTLVLEAGEDELRFADGAYMWESYDQLNNFMRNITNEDHAKLMKRKRGWDAPTTARFMLKSFARHFVEITGVRAERLQDITLGGICKEGLSKSIYDFKPATRGIDAWVELWNSINPKENTWDDNPWVWVFSFETVEATS